MGVVTGRHVHQHGDARGEPVMNKVALPSQQIVVARFAREGFRDETLNAKKGRRTLENRAGVLRRGFEPCDIVWRKSIYEESDLNAVRCFSYLIRYEIESRSEGLVSVDDIRAGVDEHHRVARRSI